MSAGRFGKIERPSVHPELLFHPPGAHRRETDAWIVEQSMPHQGRVHGLRHLRQHPMAGRFSFSCQEFREIVRPVEGPSAVQIDA